MENKEEKLEKEFQEAYGKPEVVKNKPKTIKKQKPKAETKVAVKHSDRDLAEFIGDVGAIQIQNEQRAQGKNVKSISPKEAFETLKSKYNVSKKKEA